MVEAAVQPHQFSANRTTFDQLTVDVRAMVAEICTMTHLENRQCESAQATVLTLLNDAREQLDDAAILHVEVSAHFTAQSVTLVVRDDAPALHTVQLDISAKRANGINTYQLNLPRFVAEISPREAERMAEHMANVVLPLGIALSSETDFDVLLERILLEAKSICNADAGTLYLRKDNLLHFTIIMNDSLGIHLGGSSPKPVTFPSLSLYDAHGKPNMHNVATYVALTGQVINVPDMYRAEGFDFSAAKRFDVQNNYCSVSNLTLPFKNSDGEVVGVLQLLNAYDDNHKIVPFGKYDQLMVEILTAQAAVALNTRLLWEKQSQLIRFQNDMQVARNIQNNFIPLTLPQTVGWEISGRFQPARDVSGDFYDVFTLSDGRIVLMIGDVCDKGVGAALFMSLTRSLMRAFTTQAPSQSPFLDFDIDPAALRAQLILSAVANTNSYIAQHHEALNMFTTLFIGVIDTTNGLLTYVNGGHAPPLIIGSNGSVKHRLKPTGPAVGMFGQSMFNSREVALDMGDILLCFTDGITDARANDDTQFEEESLVELLKPPAPTVEALLARLLDGVNQFIGDAVQFDDIAMVGVRRV